MNWKKNVLIILTSALISTILTTALLVGFYSLYMIKPILNEQIKDASQVVQREPSTPSLQSTESQVIQAAKKANPAVVAIVISQDVPVIDQSTDPNDPFGGFFNDPFSQPKSQQNGATEKRDVGGGSGFLVSADGLIVTNKHVVNQKKAEYSVLLNDGTKQPAEIVAIDPVFDIAIIRIKGDNLPFLTFDDSDSLQVGQTAIAIGNALAEFRNTVSVGVVSGLARTILAGGLPSGGVEQLDEVIQTDAAINPGNSGGPLLDLSGNVIGVNVAIAQGSQNIGFALPANVVSAVVTSVKSTGKIVRPYLGIRYQPITKTLQEKNKLSVDYGVIVSKGETKEDLAVIPGSPADKAGIVENDIILEIDGVKLTEGKSLASLVRKKAVGDSVVLKVLSKGEEKEVTVGLEEFKD